MPKRPIKEIVFVAVIAAMYVVLTLPFAAFSSGIIQFRLAESLTVLPALTPLAIPGVFIGCFLANVLNPNHLGLVDIVFGSLATLIAAYLSYKISLWTAKRRNPKTLVERLLDLSPAVLVNSLVVGFYLPFLLMPDQLSLVVILSTMASIFISQALVIYLIGLPLLLAVERIALFKREPGI